MMLYVNSIILIQDNKTLINFFSITVLMKQIKCYQNESMTYLYKLLKQVINILI